MGSRNSSDSLPYFFKNNPIPMSCTSLTKHQPRYKQPSRLYGCRNMTSYKKGGKPCRLSHALYSTTAWCNPDKPCTRWRIHDAGCKETHLIIFASTGLSSQCTNMKQTRHTQNIWLPSDASPANPRPLRNLFCFKPFLSFSTAWSLSFNWATVAELVISLASFQAA